MDQRGPFALPRYLVAPDSLEILELDLQGSVLKIPSDVGFSRLKSLQLVRTQLLDQNLFHNFVSSCPLLENLSLEGCLFYDFKVLDISLRNLRILFVDNDMGGGPFDERLWECVLKIACPNLAYFHLSDPFAQNFSWDKIPSLLQTATIWPWWWEDALIREELANYLLKLLRGVCHAEVLKLAGSSLPRSDLHDREWVEQRVIFTQ
ncbi:F-box/LRR-repeat protein At2g29930-like isoform X3 [Herrania umbratica]|uniref:F-box/LRR-repeat protein At2g29930-like isoform X3 n=1 Tax=Herrania umbratica TaxID=108875 RepID=A0A6J1A2R7_9ROSI|nr:F-box/LRR-repeat protein At2g29930-like isoform X3 [Herrania umbratica]